MMASNKSSVEKLLAKILSRPNNLGKILQLHKLKNHLIMEKEQLQRLKAEKPPTALDEHYKFLKVIRGGNPQLVGTLVETIGTKMKRAIVKLSGLTFVMRVCNFVDQDLLEPGANVLVSKHFEVVGCMIMKEEESLVSNEFMMETPPTETFEDVGGLDQQIEELRESVEWPLTRKKDFEQIGIEPPKGVLLYGPPGTGKTMLVKAIANATQANFFRLSASSLIKKTAGDGPQMVRNLFMVAGKMQPSIIFIDEIDALGCARYQATSSGESEVQRTMMELLARLDGFDDRKEVIVIFATNRLESLDSALIRPGRIDRLIEVPLPSRASIIKIFEIQSQNMPKEADVDAEKLLQSFEGLTGADVKAMCTEAGYEAARNKRSVISMMDFEVARDKFRTNMKSPKEDGLYL